MRQVSSVTGSFRAHVLAAHLESEGIDVQLRGALDSQYALTVGAMARVDVWVPEDQLEDAQYVLLSAEVDDAMSPSQEWDGSSFGGLPHHLLRWVAIVVLATAGLVPAIAALTHR